MKRILFTGIACIITVLIIHAQRHTADPVYKTGIRITSVDKQLLSPFMRYSGNIQQAIRWKDAQGEHTFITTETGEVASQKTANGKSAALFAYHYVSASDSTFLLWKMADGVKDRSGNATAFFIKNTSSITDLNKDGVPEVWMMFKTNGSNDAGRENIKIIMYQGNKKYVASGVAKVKTGENEFSDRACTFDETFENASASIRDHAEEMWKQYVVEK